MIAGQSVIVEGHRLVSRRGHLFTKWDVLCEEIAHSIHTMSAVLYRAGERRSCG